MGAEPQSGQPAQIGPYRVVKKLGAGGMGEVYLCRSRGGQLLAVKSIRREFADDPNFLERFRNEVAAARQVSGLYTATVVEADVDGPTPWLATLYIDAPSLAARVRGQGHLSSIEVRNLAAGLAEGLTKIHAVGLVHRDLKPSNVLLASDGPRIIDFGLARTPGRESLTRSGTIVGTVTYMSPEQARGDKAGPSSDVFSLGLVIHFAAAGVGPWGDDSTQVMLYRVVHEPPRLSADLPADLHSIVSRCLAKSPQERPTPVELLAEFGDQDLTDDVSRAASPRTFLPSTRRIPGIRTGEVILSDPGFQPGSAGSAVNEDTASITDAAHPPVRPARAGAVPGQPQAARNVTAEEVLVIALAIALALTVIAIAVIAWFINQWFAIVVYSLTAIAGAYGLLRAWLDW